MKIKLTKKTLTDGSEVFGVRVVENDGLDQASAEFACRNIKIARELVVFLDGMIREHKIVGLDAEYISCREAEARELAAQAIAEKK
jgi:hypothetical protein